MDYETVVAEIQKLHLENQKKWDEALASEDVRRTSYCDGYATALTTLWETLQDLRGQS